MNWSCSLVEPPLTDEVMTAGEWERIYLLVHAAGLPHRETDIDPRHCPTCRNAIAVVAAERVAPFDQATAAVTGLTATALVDAFIAEGVAG